MNCRYEVYIYSNGYNKHTCEMSCAVLNLLENFAFLCVCNNTRSNTFWVVRFLANIFSQNFERIPTKWKKFTQIKF